jgi:hypothetical protein
VTCHHTYVHHLKPKASTSCPSTTRSILGPALSASIHAHTSEVAAAVFREPIFRTDQCIDLAGLSVNVTILRKSIKPHPSLRPRYTTTPSLSNIDVVDANRSASKPLQQAPAPKTMPLWGRTMPHGTIIQSNKPISRVSPRAT